ncbi:mechanosensitive ion channel family protein [Woeseia oceani]|uniref:mechanosensitive ion channel family protein n=1 Tax=Woeseia oceani TaxID=1548547 RepID=UPI0009F17D4B|nr:mechanosensitive ion channel domain-containing protein [Woeseia oceani]
MSNASIPSFDIDWNNLYEKFQSIGVDFGISLITAIVIFFVGRLVARVLARGLRKLLQAQNVDKILESFVSNLVYWALMAFVIIAAITELGIETTSFIAMLGAAGLAIGLAMQGSLSNFAAGVLIVLFRHYRVGDWIEAGGVAGSVENVQILTTTLKTGDNKSIIIPNSEIMGNIIVNYSANATRRVDMVFGVGYGDDIDKVRAAIKDVISKDERIMAQPECLIAVGELADSSVNFNVRPWVKTSDYWAVKWDITEAIKKRFDEEGISIPFPQRDVHIIKDD